MGLFHCTRHGTQGRERVSMGVKAAIELGAVACGILPLTAKIEDIEFSIHITKHEAKEFEDRLGTKIDSNLCINMDSNLVVDDFLGMATTICVSCLHEFVDGKGST